MPTHKCSKEELGLEGYNARSMKPRKDALKLLELYKDKFLCLDENNLFLRGNFDTNKTSNIRIKLNRCTGKEYCKSEKEINDFIRGKYLMVYLNQIRFDQ